MQKLQKKYMAEFKKLYTLIMAYIHLGYYPKSRISRIKELLRKRQIFFAKLDHTSKKRMRLADQYLDQLGRLGDYARNKELAKITKTTYSKTLIEVEDYSYIEEYMDDYDDWYEYGYSYNEPTYEEIEIREEEICVSKPFQTILECNGEIKINSFPFAPSKYADRAEPQSHPTKLPNSISRAYHKIYELYLCNPWDYHVTITFNREWYNCKDLNGLKKQLGKWLNNYAKRKGCKKLDYVLVAEHRHGARHFHGVIRGLPPEHVTPFERGKKHPRYLVKNGYLNWIKYQEKFGYCSLRKIRNGKAGPPSYATKDLLKRQKKGCRPYMRSQGLNCFKEVCRGENLIPNIDFDFENDYVGIRTLYIKRTK